MLYLGDIADNQTVDFFWNTNDKNGKSVNRTTAGTVSVYKDNSITQTTTGVTDDSAFDSVVGLNHCRVVTTDAFYATGTNFMVVLTGATIDGETAIASVIAHFSIEQRSAVRPTTAGRTLDVAATGEAGVDFGNILGTLDAADIGASAITSAKIATGAITATTFAAGAINAAAIANAAIDAATFVAGAIDAAALNTDAVNEIRDAIVTDGVGFLGASIAQILTDTGTTLDTKINDIQGVGFATGADSLEAIRDQGDAAWITGGGGANPFLLQDTTIATLASQTDFTLVAGSADNDAYNGCVIVIEDVATATQRAVGVILDYVGSTKQVLLLTDPGVFTMATTDKVKVLASRALKSTVDNRTLDVAATGEAGVDFGNILGTLDAADIGADAITSAKIATGAITATTFAAGAINAAAIANAAIDAATFVAGAIDAAALNTDAVNEIRDAIVTDGVGFLGASIAQILTDTGTTLDTKIDDIQGVGFVSATHSLEAIRVQGDAADRP